MSCTNIAVIAQTSPSCVYTRGMKYGWDSVVVFWPNLTRKEFKAKLQEHGLYHPPSKHESVYKRFIYDEETGENIPYVRIGEMFGVSSDTIAAWMHNNNCRTVRDCKARSEWLRTRKERSDRGLVNKHIKFISPSTLEGNTGDDSGFGTFDRTAQCFRYGGTERCKHYNECQDTRIFTARHGPRFLENGKCYDGEPIAMFYTGSSGQKVIGRLDARERR